MKLLLLPSVFLVLATVSLESSEGSRILCVFPLHVKSHFMMFDALMKGLARKGHQVDVVSTFPLKKPYANYTDIIVLPRTRTQLFNSVTYNMLNTNIKAIVPFVSMELGNKICQDLGHPEILKLIKNPPRDPPYDLMITQVLSANCFLALGHHLKVPVIGVSSSALYPWHHRIIANPANLAFVPNNLINYVAPMTFWQRLHNTVDAVYTDLYFQYLSRSQDAIIKKYLGEETPGVREAERSLALILVNSHPSLNGPKPITPAVIEVGGLHVQDDHSEVSQDLQDWMDNSTDGFIYFSFGSMFVVESLPPKIIKVIYKSFEKIAPVRVLIKIINPRLLPTGLPKNFRTFEWVPQYKILKHKNIKAFVTHGGLMGTQEAVHCAVPMIGIPLAVDQFVNIDRYAKIKIAVRLNSIDITEEQMDAALKEILYNPVYKNTMVNVSAKFLDRPMSSMETAMWWVEYVIRHGGYDLRSPAMDLAWWQVELLDVYGFILLSVTFIVFMIIILVRFFIKKLITFKNSMGGYKKKAE